MKCCAMLRGASGRKREVFEVPEEFSVGDLMGLIVEGYGEPFHRCVYDAERWVRDFLSFMLNGVSVGSLEGFGTVLGDGDVLAIPASHRRGLGVSAGFGLFLYILARVFDMNGIASERFWGSFRPGDCSYYTACMTPPPPSSSVFVAPLFEVGLGSGLRCYLYLYGAVNVWWARGLVRIRRQLAELLVVGSNPTGPAITE